MNCKFQPLFSFVRIGQKCSDSGMRIIRSTFLLKQAQDTGNTAIRAAQP